MKKVIYCGTVWVFWISVFGLPLLSAAADLTPHEFIAGAFRDPLVKTHQRINASTENAPADTPFLREVELRAGIDEMDATQQNYQLRFSPRGFGETKYNRKLTELSGQAKEIDAALYLCNALKKRYLLVLEYISVDKLLKHHEALKAVYIDRVKVLQHLSAMDVDSDISALITAEDKLSRTHLQLIEFKNRLAGLAAAVNHLDETKTDIAFDDASIIDMEKIETVLKEQSSKPDGSNVYLDQAKFEIGLNEGELKLRQAKNRDWLNFFQVTYKTDEDIDELEHKISFEIGVRLPITVSDQEEIWRRRVDLNREKMQYEAARKEALAESGQLLRETVDLLAQYRLLKEKSKTGSAVTTLNKHLSLKGADPLDLLKLKEIILENDISLTELSTSIRSNYIECMDLAGRLAGKPLIDYLSNTLEPL